MKQEPFRMMLYNLGFMGGRREGALSIDGQYLAICDGQSFSIFKVGGYGNFTSFPETEGELAASPLSLNEWRYVNDAMLNSIKRFGGIPTEEDLELFAHSRCKYDFINKPISANIQWGDLVVDIYDNTTFKVDSNHDINHINRNYRWKLVERSYLHPEPMTLTEFILLNESNDPFEDWKIVEPPKRTKDMIFERYTINGEAYEVIKNYGGRQSYYIITPKGTVYCIESNISAPFYNTIEILTGSVWSQYDETTEGKRYEWAYKEVVHEVLAGTDSFIPHRYKKFTETSSYRLNTRSTYLK